MSGDVYVLTNIAMPRIVKIGHSFDAELRAQQLSWATGVPCNFDVAYAQHVDYAPEVESAAHELLADYRVNDRREFFYTRPANAVSAIQIAALVVAWNRAGKDAREEFLLRIERPIMDQQFA